METYGVRFLQEALDELLVFPAYCNFSLGSVIPTCALETLEILNRRLEE
jgi:hypothetical protein